jgi:hypothetical protein
MNDSSLQGDVELGTNSAASYPMVLVQIPMYNEKEVKTTSLEHLSFFSCACSVQYYVTLQNNIFPHIQVLVTYLHFSFSNLTHKTKTGTLQANRVVRDYPIATHLDQSNYLANQKQGVVNKYDFTVYYCCCNVSPSPSQEFPIS